MIGRRRAAVAAIAALALTGPAVADRLPDGWDLALAGAPVLPVRAEPVELAGGRLSGLAAAGAWVLTGESPDFGGLSGLHIDGDRLFAVSDKGWWFGATLAGHGAELTLFEARLAPMRDGEGIRYTKAGGDAEGLTRRGPHLFVSFERDHRLMALRETGRVGATIQRRRFEQFRSNMGLEALATLPDGRLLALAEGTDGSEVPVFVVDPAGTVTEARLPSPGPHAVTGADVGPDGWLYLVLRQYSVLFGISIRVMRYRIGPNGLPQPETAETLAAFESDSGIGNMEGISLDRAPSGETWLWLIADDNFRAAQRTLLVRFEVRP